MGKILMSRQELGEMRENVSHDISKYDVEALMTCFALAEHCLYGFGAKRIARSLQYIDGLMDDVIRGKATIEDYKKELEDETGVSIKSD